MWDESIAGRGGNEMASCFINYVNALNPAVINLIECGAITVPPKTVIFKWSCDTYTLLLLIHI